MPITVEGIESEEILEALKRLGELKGQGYFYGKPETAHEVLDRLRKIDMLRLSEEPSEADVDRDTETTNLELPRRAQN